MARRAVLILIAAILGTAPGSARAADKAPATDTSPTAAGRQGTHLRNFTLRNMATQAITDANVKMTNNSATVLTKGQPIQPNQNQAFTTDEKGCLESIWVQFKGGRTLTSNGLNECHATSVVVRDDKISFDSSANPSDSAAPVPPRPPAGP